MRLSVSFEYSSRRHLAVERLQNYHRGSLAPPVTAVAQCFSVIDYPSCTEMMRSGPKTTAQVRREMVISAFIRLVGLGPASRVFTFHLLDSLLTETTKISICLHMTSYSNMGKESYSFEKLKGADNYKEWALEMSFVLKDAGLMGFVTGTAVKPVHDRNEKRPDRVDKKQEAIDIWLEKDSRAVGKLGKMCTRTVQSEFNDTWTAKQAWEALKERYTPVGWSSKWAVLNQLEEASYQNSSGIAEMGRTMRTVLEEIHEQKITIDEYVTIKIINSLGPGFKTYVTVLNEHVKIRSYPI